MQRRTLYGGGLVATGLLLAGTQFVQGLQQIGGFEGTDRLLVFSFETVPFLLVALALAFVGYWLTTQQQFEPDLPRILAWGAGSTLLFASVGALFVFSQQVTGSTFQQAQYIAMNQVTVGAVVGVLVGLYDARSRLRQRELQAERDRVETFAQKAADVNNYGRELNRSTSLAEVSSLCIQGLQTFLEVTEMAFVVTDGEEHEFVDNTVLDTPEEALGGVVDGTLDQEPGAVVTESTPDGVDRGERVIRILITSHEDSSVVLLAFSDGPALGEEDVQLIEMLVAHAATAVDRIHERRVSVAGGDASGPSESVTDD